LYSNGVGKDEDSKGNSQEEISVDIVFWFYLSIQAFGFLLVILRSLLAAKCKLLLTRSLEKLFWPITKLPQDTYYLGDRVYLLFRNGSQVWME